MALKTLLARLQADQARMQLELETQQKDHVEQQGVITKLQTDLDEQVAKTADATDRVKALETAASDAPPVVKKKAFPITVVPAADQSKTDGDADWIPLGLFPVRRLR